MSMDKLNLKINIEIPNLDELINKVNKLADAIERVNKAEGEKKVLYTDLEYTPDKGIKCNVYDDKSYNDCCEDKFIQWQKESMQELLPKLIKPNDEVILKDKTVTNVVAVSSDDYIILRKKDGWQCRVKCEEIFQVYRMNDGKYLIYDCRF